MDRSLVTRRQLIRNVLATGIGVAAGAGVLSACRPLAPNTCTPPQGEDPGVGWGPSVLAPVFYGFADYEFAPGQAVRMFYPSIQSRATCARILGGTAARYPLVLFLHGDCSREVNHYLQWSHLPSILARAGFVVAVPKLESFAHPTNPGSSTYARAAAVLNWARTSWDYRHLLFSSVTGVMGHSFGSLHAQQIAKDTNPTAFVCLSGQQAEFNTVPLPTCPKMFVFGTGESPVFRLPDSVWNSLTGHKHRLVLAGLHHWDYAPFTTNTCADGLASQCGQYHRIAADMVAIFFSRYMSSEHSGILTDFIPANLVLPSVIPTPQQETFADDWLFSLSENNPDCSATLSWSVPFPGGVSQGDREVL